MFTNFYLEKIKSNIFLKKLCLDLTLERRIFIKFCIMKLKEFKNLQCNIFKNIIMRGGSIFLIPEDNFSLKIKMNFVVENLK